MSVTPKNPRRRDASEAEKEEISPEGKRRRDSEEVSIPLSPPRFTPSHALSVSAPKRKVSPNSSTLSSSVPSLSGGSSYAHRRNTIPATALLPAVHTHHSISLQSSLNLASQAKAKAGASTSSSHGVRGAQGTAGDVDSDVGAGGNFSLIDAALAGDIEMVKGLCERADVNASDLSGATPLMVAIKRHHHNLVSLLLEWDAQANVRDNEGYAPIHHAAEENDCKSIRLLSEIGEASMDYATENDGLSALHLAASKGHVEAIQLLLELGANVNAKSKRHSTPLNKSVCKNQLEATRKLLEWDADISAKDENDRTPVHWACFYQRAEHLDVLLSNNQHKRKGTAFTHTLDAKDKAGQTAEDIAASKQKGKELLEIIRRYKAKG